MCPGIRPATGWIAYLTSTPLASSARSSSRTACWACATAIPYPGAITTSRANDNWIATSCALVERTVPPFAPPAPTGAATAPPNPPATIAGTDRFIALAIRLVRIDPDAPTIIPATINAVLFSAIPVAAADRPVNAFNNEITTGISAPPIGNTTMFPNTAAATRIPKKNSTCECDPAVRMIAETTQTLNSARLISDCPGNLIGRPGKISCNFPNAIFDPQNDTDPTIAANNDGISTRNGKSPPK